MQMAGAALHKYSSVKPTSIGIVPYRCINHRRRLEVGKPEDVYIYSPRENKDERKEQNLANLNKHHTHFIFVDDGRDSTWGSEIKTRAEIESTFADTYSVPLVLLVADGGIGTLETMLNFARQSHPIIVIASSDRAASAMDAFYKRVEEAFRAERKFPEFCDDKAIDKMREIVRVDAKLRKSLLTFIQTVDDIKLHMLKVLRRSARSCNDAQSSEPV